MLYNFQKSSLHIWTFLSTIPQGVVFTNVQSALLDSSHLIVTLGRCDKNVWYPLLTCKEISSSESILGLWSWIGVILSKILQRNQRQRSLSTQDEAVECILLSLSIQRWAISGVLCSLCSEWGVLSDMCMCVVGHLSCQMGQLNSSRNPNRRKMQDPVLLPFEKWWWALFCCVSICGSVCIMEIRKHVDWLHVMCKLGM
jgi:hypothetical protein